MGLLSGLDIFGLGNLESRDIFEKKQSKSNKDSDEEAKPVERKEEDFLFDKTYECPVCNNEVVTKTVRSGKARLLGTDLDLRQKHEGIDMLKYDTVVCPSCGYAALTRYFTNLTSAQAKLVRAAISENFKGIPEYGATYTYDQAFDRYKLALANAVVKRAKTSEKAYICLKSAWLIRGMIENLDQTEQSYLFKSTSLGKQEKEYLENALDGFLEARQSENFPICGMDESTFDYLVAVLAMERERYDISMRIIGSLISSSQVNSRTKEKARELKEILHERMREV